MLNEFVSNAAHVVDFMNNSPNWQGNDTSVRSVFRSNIHEMLSGTITPQECAKALNKTCNAVLQTGSQNSKLPVELQENSTDVELWAKFINAESG